jgi:hypothetical protein
MTIRFHKKIIDRIPSKDEDGTGVVENIEGNGWVDLHGQ